ncbi:hypothetical protein HHI36_003250 [Cryptolaemus montrouzieri]|uniref:Uncharacterized protein n=1 Tax=Cryptolaemus montrouzieri TaxID=559131 RepID=A0ABD2PCX9_9CUCU
MTLFGKVIKTQLEENYTEVNTHDDRKKFNQAISGNVVNKHKLERIKNKAVRYEKTGHNMTEKQINVSKIRMQQLVQNFFVDDFDIQAAGKKEFVSCKQVKNQKRYLLGCELQDILPNIEKYTWNFHEAGHGKGVGATCERTADQEIATEGDITNLNEFATVIREKCPGIIMDAIEECETGQMNTIIIDESSEMVAFKGTLLVHEVTGIIFPTILQ